MKIVTGKAGIPHVSAQQFRQLVEGTVGQESYILASGENLEPELSTNNLLKIRSGMMSHHGNISCVELGTYDEVTIQNGNQGMKRIDLVVNRYSKNDETGFEENNWVVLMGTPDTEAPVAPAYTEGNLQEGDLVDDCPVFEMHLDGINVTKVKKLLSVTPDMSTLNAELSDLNSKYNNIKMYRMAYETTLEYNNYSGQEFGHITIPKADLEKYGEIVSVECRGSSSLPGIAYHYADSDGNTYVYAQCIDSKVKIWVDFLKVPK